MDPGGIKDCAKFIAIERTLASEIRGCWEGGGHMPAACGPGGGATESGRLLVSA